MSDQGSIRMEIVSDPEELARSREQDHQSDRNTEWLENHASEVYACHRGKHICIAGQELFVGATAEEALALAKAAHPEDRGRFLRYIPAENVTRVYAN